MTGSSRIFFFAFSALFLLATALFAWFQEIYFLVAPLALLAGLYFLQHPLHLVYALLLTIPWSIEFNFTPSLGTDLPDEPLMLLAAFATIIMAIAGRNQFREAKWRHPLLFILLLQVIWMLLVTTASTEKLLSVKYVLAKSWYLLAFVALPIMLFSGEKIIRRAAAMLSFSMLLFMLYALVRHQQYNFTFERINTALEPFYRNHVNYSALLVFTVPLQVAAIQLAASKRTRNLLLVLLVICLIALYFSYARGAWLALVVAIAGYWLIRKRLLFFSFFLFVFLVLGAVIWLRANNNYLKFSHDFKSTVFHTNFREHLAATYQFRDASTAERFYRWVAGVRMAGEKWETGFGPASFYRQYRSYTQPAFKTWVSDNPEQSTVHNYFLLMMLEQGAMGLLLFLVLLGALFWYAQTIYHRTTSRFWKIASAAIAAILLMECAVNFLSDMIETDKAGPVFYLCVAVLVIADISTRREEKVQA